MVDTNNSDFEKEEEIKTILGKTSPSPPPEAPEEEEEGETEPSFGEPLEEAEREKKSLRERAAEKYNKAADTVKKAKKAINTARKVISTVRNVAVIVYQAIAAIIAFLGGGWVVILIAVVSIPILALVIFLFVRPNFHSSGSQFVSIHGDPRAQENINRLASMHPNFDFDKPNNLARLVMPKEDWQAIKNGEIDARVVNFLTLLTQKCGHIKVSLKKGYETEDKKLSNESEPGSLKTISAHYTGQAVDVYECGLTQENGWKQTRTVKIAEQRTKDQTVADSLNESLNKLEQVLQKFPTPSLQAQPQAQELTPGEKEKLEQALASWQPTAKRLNGQIEEFLNTLSNLEEQFSKFKQNKSAHPNLTLNQEADLFSSLVNVLTSLNTIANIAPRPLDPDCQKKFPAEIEKLDAYLPTNSRTTLSDISNYSCPLPEDSYDPSLAPLTNLTEGIPLVFDNLAALANFYYSTASNYRYYPEAIERITQSFLNLAPSLKDFFTTLKILADNQPLNEAETLNKLNASTEALISQSQGAVKSLEGLPQEFHGELYNVLSSLEELSRLKDLDPLTTKIGETVEALRLSRINNYSSETEEVHLEILKKQLEELEQSLSTLANLNNLELLNNYPFELGFNAADFQPLNNLEALANLEFLARLASFSLPPFIEQEKSDSLNTILRSALSYLGNLSYLANLSIIDQQYNFFSEGCYISEDLSCGLGSLQFLETLADFGKDAPLTKLSLIAPSLRPLSELKIYSDPVLAASIEKTVDLSGFSLENPTSISELEKLTAKEEEPSLDEEIERLKNEIKQEFINQGVELPADFNLAVTTSALNKALLVSLKEGVIKRTGEDPEILQEEIRTEIEKEVGRLPSDFDLEELLYKLKVRVYSGLVKELGYSWDFGLSTNEVDTLIKSKTQEAVEQTLPPLLEEASIRIKESTPDLKERLTSLISAELAVQLQEETNLNSAEVKEAFQKELEKGLKKELNIEPENIDLELLNRNYESRVRAIRAKIAREKPWIRHWDDHLTQVAPQTIYKPKAIKTVRDLVNLGLSLPEEDRPHQILASVKLGETSQFAPNYGSMLSSLYTKVHFGF